MENAVGDKYDAGVETDVIAGQVDSKVGFALTAEHENTILHLMWLVTIIAQVIIAHGKVLVWGKYKNIFSHGCLVFAPVWGIKLRLFVSVRMYSSENEH